MSSSILDFVKDFSVNNKTLESTVVISFLKKYIDCYQNAKHIQREKINVKLLDIENRNDDYLNSDFVCVEARKYIKRDYNYMLQYTIPINNRKVNVYFYISEYNTKQIKNYNKKVLQIITIYLFLSTMSSKFCGKVTNIYIALTPLKKMMPSNNMEVFDAKHINSAVTNGCELNSIILIYRQEEWYKVLIHELMHSLGLDFSHHYTERYSHALRETLQIKSDYLVNETYCEIWATILNTLAFTYVELFQGQSFEDIDTKLFYVMYNDNLNIERTFSILQVAKILNHMNLKYSQLWSNNGNEKLVRRELYREKTNVLCYFILKQTLLLHSSLFIEWCIKHNGEKIIPFSKSSHSIISFVDELIKLSTNKKTMVNSLYGIKILNDISDDVLLDTCKMTILSV